MILRHLGGVLLKKNFLLRVDEEIFDKVKDISEVEDRSINYMMCKLIDKVFICTDSETIKETVQECFKDEEKIECIDRPAETATDTASTESVLLYFANKYNNFNNVILVQATSPLLTCHDLENALNKYKKFNYDSMLSVVKQKRFVWKKNDQNHK